MTVERRQRDALREQQALRVAQRAALEARVLELLADGLDARTVGQRVGRSRDWVLYVRAKTRRGNA